MSSFSLNVWIRLGSVDRPQCAVIITTMVDMCSTSDVWTLLDDTIHPTKLVVSSSLLSTLLNVTKRAKADVLQCTLTTVSKSMRPATAVSLAASSSNWSHFVEHCVGHLTADLVTLETFPSLRSSVVLQAIVGILSGRRLAWDAPWLLQHP